MTIAIEKARPYNTGARMISTEFDESVERTLRHLHIGIQEEQPVSSSLWDGSIDS